MRTMAEYDGTVTLRGHEYDVLITYRYDGSGLVDVGKCYTHNGKESRLLKRRAELELPIFIDKQIALDRAYREKLYRDDDKAWRGRDVIGGEP